MSTRTWVIASVALIGLGAVTAVALAARHGEPAAEPPSWTEPSSLRTTPKPVDVPAPGEPVSCAAGREPETCFPDIDLPTVQRQLEALGTTCTRDPLGTTVSCMAGTDSHGAEIRMEGSRTEPAKIAEVWFVASSGGTGTASEHRQRATGNLSEALDNVLPLLLPRAPGVAGDVAGWVKRTTGQCAATSVPQAVIGKFEVRCLNGSPITVSGKKGTVTSWTVTAILSAPHG